jgi:DNA-binding PadR family transcriptional regulator
MAPTPLNMSSNGSTPDPIRAASAVLDGPDQYAIAQALTDLAVHLTAASHAAEADPTETRAVETEGAGATAGQLRQLAVRCQRSAARFVTGAGGRADRDGARLVLCDVAAALRPALAGAAVPRLGRQTRAILGVLLAEDRPMYVGEIEQLVPGLPPRNAPHYLHRLHERGWVTATPEPPVLPQSPRGRRTYYALTAKGRAAGARALEHAAHIERVARATAAAQAAAHDVLAQLVVRVDAATAAIIQRNSADATVTSALRDLAALLTAVACRLERDGDLELAVRFAALGRTCDSAALRWSTPQQRTEHDRQLAWRALRPVALVLRHLTTTEPDTK